jgi:serine/threonine-protein kinase
MTERAALEPALSGRYDIEREIGRGGMAVVFLARDLKHSRRVAIKMLSLEFSGGLGADRFLGEIRVTANLQHPNILALFDSGEAAGRLYYVMPFIEGETLRARLDREKQLPVDEALRIAVAMANAAEYAHARGVVHRDLKPENILLQSGQPIVADFGIALALSNAAGARMTQTGMSLGTPQYMSPEQATGDRIIDARSDVYALGAMTYEMLIGEPPHTGSTSQAIIARILTERPRSVRESRESVPEHVSLAIARSLEKLPADRFVSAKEFAEALQGSVPIRTTGESRRAPRRSRAAMIGIVGASLVAVAASLGWWRAAHSPPPVANRFVVEPPPGISIGGGSARKVALSHDGQLLAFSSTMPESRLLLRHLGQLEPIAFPYPKISVPGPELHFSEDGKWLAYWRKGPRILPVTPGDTAVEPRQLAQVPAIGHIAYFGSDLIYLFANEFFTVSVSGGTPRKLASMDTLRDIAWQWPMMLPDHKTIAFAVVPRRRGPPRLALMSADGGTPTLLDLEATSVIGCVDGILVFMRGNRLFAVKFDVGGRKVVGEPVDLIADRIIDPTRVAVSDNGTLAYLADAAPDARLEIIDRLGNVTASLPEIRAYAQPVVSPDGKHIAVIAESDGPPDLWIYSVESRVFTRLTQVTSSYTAWTPDSKRIAFRGADRLFDWMPADGSAAPEPIPNTTALKDSPGFYTQLAFSPDNKYLIVLREFTPSQTRPASPPSHLTLVPLAGGAPIGTLEDAEAPHSFSVSPNGKWIAYQSRETNRYEVFIRSFPSGSAKLQLSTDGGDQPKWSPDGRQVVFRSDKLFREATLDFSGPVPRVVRTDTLFGSQNAGFRRIDTYGVHPDGKHFVVARPVGDGTKLVVVTNWITEVRAKLAGN